MGIQAATAAGMASVRVPPPSERRKGTTPSSLRRIFAGPPALTSIRIVFRPQSASSQTPRRIVSADTVILFAIAAAVALLHLLTNSRYGFHRDELQFSATPATSTGDLLPTRPSLRSSSASASALFGLSMVGLRLFSVLAQAAVIIVTGLMARELGGGRLAQVTAALAVGFLSTALFEGHEFQYTSFDFLWWVLIAYFVVRLLKSENPRWWLAIGAAIGPRTR